MVSPFDRRFSHEVDSHIGDLFIQKITGKTPKESNEDAANSKPYPCAIVVAKKCSDQDDVDNSNSMNMGMMIHPF